MKTYIIKANIYTEPNGGNLSCFYFKGWRSGKQQWAGIALAKRYKTMRGALNALNKINYQAEPNEHYEIVEY